MKLKYKLAFMDMAERFAETSTAERLKVGALIVKNDSIVALGINGMPPRWTTEECEVKEYFNKDSVSHIKYSWLKQLYPGEDEKGHYKLITKPECRHAEVAALEKLWNSSETAKGAAMFISHSPCRFCSIKIFTSGISRVFYRYEYRDLSGVEYLKQNGVEVEQI